MMKTKKGKKKKPAGTPFNFRQLLSLIQKHEASDVLIKTAVTTGWLWNGDFLTRLTESEMDEVRKVYVNKRVEIADLSKVIPTIVGYLIDDIKITGQSVRVSDGNGAETVSARLFLTMQRRHPDASVYFSQDRKTIIFSGRTTLAVLPVEEKG